jgi:hypothetical protein
MRAGDDRGQRLDPGGWFPLPQGLDEREDAHPGIPDRFEPSDNEVWPHAFSVTR